MKIKINYLVTLMSVITFVSVSGHAFNFDCRVDQQGLKTKQFTLTDGAPENTTILQDTRFSLSVRMYDSSLFMHLTDAKLKKVILKTDNYSSEISSFSLENPNISVSCQMMH